MFREFGAILNQSTILTPGMPYVFTYEQSGLFSFYSTDNIQSALNDVFQTNGVATVQSVSRPLFSGRIQIILVPVSTYDASTWISMISAVLQQGGWDFNFIQVEGGTSSTSPGGIAQLPQVVSSVVQTAVSPIAESLGEATGKTAANILSPLLPYLLIFGAGFLIYMNPSILKSFSGKGKK